MDRHSQGSLHDAACSTNLSILPLRIRYHREINMALDAEITSTEILGRIPDGLEPADLTTAIVDVIREQVAGYIEDISGTIFTGATPFLNTARFVCINYAAVIAVIYAGADPEVNASFSPDGELKVSLTSMPKAISNFINSTLGLSKIGFQLLLNINPSNTPTSNITVAEG